MTDLATEYLGLRLKSPIVASAGPLTGDVRSIVELERAGVAAVVLPSLFEEQIEHETAEVERLYTLHNDSFGEAVSFLPEVGVDDDCVSAYVSHIERVKEQVDVPVIASLNGTNIGGWLRYAQVLEDAGADAIELNLYSVAADPHIRGAEIEAEHLELVAVLAGEVRIPIAVKISPSYSSVASFVVGLEAAGAGGVVMFNRFYLPDLDLETLEVRPRLALSNSGDVQLPLRWAGILREHLTMSIACSSGVHSGFDVAKLVLAGADVAMTTSALLRHGADHVATIEQQLRSWMSDHDYASVTEMRGAVSRAGAADPAAYERANYIGNLAAYTNSFRGADSIGPARGTARPA